MNNQLLASDNFASGSLAAGWSAVPGQSVCQVVAGPPNFTEANTVGTVAGQIWTGITWPNDHASEVTVTMTGSAVATTLIQLHVRNQGGGSYSGYRAIINDSGAWEIDVVTAGTPTSLTSGTGLTIAANDVWVLQAAGSCISLYQNGNRVGYVGDVTYTLGSPGYSQQATTTLNTNEVFSWRGYSAIQQDGIWQKQGVALAPIAADLASSGDGIYEANCLYDSNPQILAGPNVYKLWFSAGPVLSSSVYYAESPDLQNWTRHSGAVIANVVSPTVIKVGATYHLYCQAASLPGSGATQHFTSSDGINWTLQSANVFSTGAYPLKPIAIVNGTWYALWGSLGASDFPSVNLATSPDGVTWTAYGSNPVISGAYPFACVAQVGSTFYVWMQRGPSSGQNTAPASLFDPNESVRFSTTDFIHWTGPVHSFHHSQMFESLNTPVNNTEAVGGNAASAIFNINGKATMLVNASPGDNIGPQVAQFYTAVAPTSIANVVLFPEDAVAQTSSDSFARAAGTLASPWTNVGAFGTLKIVSSGLVEPSALNTDSFMVYSGTFSTSLYSEITVATSSVAKNICPCIANTAGTAIYFTNILGPTGTQGFTAQIGYYNGSVNLFFTPLVGLTIQVGDVIRLSLVRSATSDVLSIFQNGSLISQGVNFTQPASLLPGIYLTEASAGQTQISLWAGGNANVIPNYPGSGIFGELFGYEKAYLEAL